METLPPPRGTATRENVLAHAAALIRERGFRSTSIGDLLGHAVLDRWISELKSRLLDPLTAADGPPPLERIAACLDGFVAEQDKSGCRGGCPFGNLAIELADVHEGFRARLSKAFQSLADA